MEDRDDIEFFRKQLEGSWGVPEGFFGKLEGFVPNETNLIIVDFDLTRPLDTSILIFFNGYLVEHDYTRPLLFQHEVADVRQSLFAKFVRKLGSTLRHDRLASYGVGSKVVDLAQIWNPDSLDLVNNTAYVIRLAQILQIPRICIVDMPGVDLSRLKQVFPAFNIDIVPAARTAQVKMDSFMLLRELLSLRYIRLYKDSLLYKMLSEVTLEPAKSGNLMKVRSDDPKVSLAANLCLSLARNSNGELVYVGSQ